MIDGLKIYNPYLDYRKLLNNEKLTFLSVFNEKTGEVLQNSKTARYKGLIFRLSPSTIDKEIVHKTIRGSVHKYFNNGLHNANDFSFSDFCNTVDKLSNEFEIVPEKSILQGFEIGININLPITAKQFINDYLISLPRYKLTELTAKKGTIKIPIGKEVVTNDYRLKFYHKNPETLKTNKNLLRIELKILKMRKVEKLKIKTLSDLTDLNKYRALAVLFFDTVKDVIIYNNSIVETNLTLKEQLFLAKHINPLFWQKLNKNDRYAHKQRFTNFLIKHNAHDFNSLFTKLISDKINFLVNSQRFNIDVCTNFLNSSQQVTNPNEQNKNIANSQRFDIDVCTRIINGANVLLKDLKSNTNFDENKQSKNHINENKKNTCSICGKPITSKQKNAKFCSVKCRNKANYNTKKAIKHKEIQAETDNLTEILSNLDKIRFKVTFLNSSEKTELTRSKINFDYEKRKSIKHIQIKIKNKTFELTTRRAKKLIKVITDYNKIKYAKKRYCKQCYTEITEHPKQTKFCSVKCRNKHYKDKKDKVKQRKQNRQQAKKEQLKRTIKTNEYKDLNINIYIKDKISERKRIIKASELHKIKITIKDIQKITAYNGKAYKLNKQTSKQFLKEVMIN